MNTKSKKDAKHRKPRKDSDRNTRPKNTPPIPGVAPPEEPQVGDELPPDDEYGRKYGSDKS